MNAVGRSQYLEQCKALVFRELERTVPTGPLRSVLYDRMLDYPRRAAKSLRPALCIATCRALGGGLEAVLPTASVLELYHNAFLVHDDIEDGSELRRDLPTLHQTYGIPIAINVGDAMLALALSPLLENTRTVGLGKALRILKHVAEMARITAEGQAVELEWIRTGRFDLRDEDYFDMVARKTSHYSFVTPMQLGAILAGQKTELNEQLDGLGRDLGLAFQIQDDVLNLTADYGKERDGDLYEGKYTLILLHLLRSSNPDELHNAAAILAKPRAGPVGVSAAADRLRVAIHGLATSLPSDVTETLLAACDSATGLYKTDDDVAFLKLLADKYGSVQYAQDIAHRFAASAARRFDELKMTNFRTGIDTEFLESLIDYVVERKR